MPDDDKEKDRVRTEGSSVYFFCEVSDETILELCSALRRVSKEHDTITLYIRSEGGDAYAGIAGMDYIHRLVSRGIHVHTHALGLCASAATFLLLAGSRRTMGPYSSILIHQLSGGSWGTFEQLRDDMREYEKLMRHMRRMYKRKTKLTDTMLDKLFTRDMTLSARKCIKYSVVEALE